MNLSSQLNHMEKLFLVQWMGKTYVNTLLAGFEPFFHEDIAPPIPSCTAFANLHPALAA